MQKYVLVSVLIVGWMVGTAKPVSAQIQKIFHQSFEISDTINAVSLQLVGNTKYEPWLGNAVLVETNISIEGINENLFDYFNKQGRYSIESLRADSTLVISSKVQKRSEIRTKEGLPAREKVNVRVFMPEEFMTTDSVTWRKN